MSYFFEKSWSRMISFFETHPSLGLSLGLENMKISVSVSKNWENKLGLSWAKLSSSCVKLIRSYDILRYLNRFD